MPRPAWSGFIRFSLVTIPVQAYSAQSSEGSDIAFHQLHEKCNSRIRYKKVCPIHGEVPNSEIVSGYEYEKGKYVIVEDDEKKQARESDDAATTNSLRIESFVPTDEIDPLYFEGRSYFLLPDGDAGDKPYALLCKAMQDERRAALAEAVLWRRERLLLIRATGRLLMMSILKFAGELRKPDDFADDAPRETTKAAELKLAKRLIAESTTDKVDWSAFENDARKHLSAVIQQKVSEDETVETDDDADEGPVINLMDALKRSVAKSRGKATKPARRGKAHTKTLPLRAAAHRTRPKSKAKKRKVS